MNKFMLRLADGRWVSSPTDTVTANPNLAAVFAALDEAAPTAVRQSMEAIHGPLELVPWATPAIPRGHPPTLGAEIEGQIRLINAAPSASERKVP